jgi:hypothetical protein
MLILTIDAVILCDHPPGKVKLEISQKLVTISGREVLVEKDPEGRPIAGCPNYGLGIRPCLHTMPVKEGYSELLRIEGRRVCLDSVHGLTDGTPQGGVDYKVRAPGQDFVSGAL